ncbi:hypothetical protein [Pseudarthrobacter sp. TAF60_1]|uniref:hypothetical protein n=1 Tax=Pseudarthrobacter sp. TAF60_1 TaxID=3233071 RepID=UPI003F9DB2E9
MPAVLISECAAEPSGASPTHGLPSRRLASEEGCSVSRQRFLMGHPEPLPAGISVADECAAAAPATTADAAQTGAAPAPAPATGWSPAGVLSRNWARLPLGMIIPDALLGLKQKWAVKRWA